MVLKRFGYNIDNLNGPKVHSLYNTMTMEKNMHDNFDRLEIWFEPTVSITIVVNVAFLTISFFLGSYEPIQAKGLLPSHFST